MPKFVLVTGAGSGIGQAAAIHLAEQDYKLVLLGRRGDALEKTRAALKSPEAHIARTCDIRDSRQILQALVDSKIPTLYAVVANAGLGGENVYGDKDRWREIIDTNLTGSYHTVRECLSYLRKDARRYKKILFVSSILARLGVPGYSAYCASKAGILGLMRSLSAELAPERILVNALCPGWVNTDMAHQGLEGMAAGQNISKEEATEKAMSQVPLGKMSEPEEIARLIAFLLAEDQTSITGQTIDINNGAIMP